MGPPRPASDDSRSSSGSTGASKRPIDPITRTALRYTISPREYELLHQYLISRAPERVQKRTPNPPRYERIIKSASETGDYNVASFRAALRVFVAAYTGLKGWEVISRHIANRRGGAQSKSKAVVHRHPNARIALSLSTILLFHRLLTRFFRRLRASLLEGSAEPWRNRNPTLARLLTSKYTPAVGSSLAGLCLGVSPADQLRITVAIYTFSRSLEFGYNALSESGYIWPNGKPSWFGSWLIMPFACGQLLHAFVLDRDCFPESYGRFILRQSPEYIQTRPADYPLNKPWPATFDIVDALAGLSKLKWPAFISPILFPGKKETLPPTLAKVGPFTSSAHPLITHTSCAVLHPKDPSCSRTYLKYFLRSFPSVARFFTLIYGAFAMLAYKSLLKDPMPFLNRLAARILRMSVFITGAIGTSWGSICLFNNYLPRAMLPTQRWFLGGFLGGLWAYVARNGERGNFLYSLRLSIDSLWKVGRKRGWWKGVKNGDVLVFVASLALLNVVYEGRPSAVKGAAVRKAMGVVRGDGWVDRAEAKHEAVKAEAAAETTKMSQATDEKEEL